MRKLLLLCGVIIICTLICSAVAAAAGDAPVYTPNSLLNVYKVEDSIALGLQQHLWGNLYGAADIEYWNLLKELRFHAGATYFIPREVLFLKFYGGVGYQFSRDNTASNCSYLQFGTRFFFVFAEALYPLAVQAKPEYKLGLSLDFSRKTPKSSTSGEVADKNTVQYDYELAPDIKSIKITNDFGEVEVKTGIDGVISLIADIEIRAAHQREYNLYRDDFKITGKPQNSDFIISTLAPAQKYGLAVPIASVKMVVYVPSGVAVYVNGKSVEPFVSSSL